MKITTNNMGTYEKVAGKEKDGVMSLAMFDLLVDGDRKVKSIGVVTPEMLFNLKLRNEAFRTASEEWDAINLPDWAR